MSKFKAFRCGECGDTVRLVAKTGRVAEYRRGVNLPVPDDFEIPTCPTCAEQYFTVALSDALAERQAALFPEWKRKECASLIDRIRTHHQVTLRQIEGACAVTPTYLSHVLSGGKQPSLTLVRLLQAFAVRPEEFKRQLAGTPWTEALRERSHPSRGGRPSMTVGLAVGAHGQGSQNFGGTLGLQIGTGRSIALRTALITGLRVATPDEYAHASPPNGPSNDNAAA